ncbi:valine--tRNA ligase [Hyalella azteca]|uniref:Valine--tRNA ligase n=1 Tax=Hyalella azteca TaxID=294128 RepID=A0A979FMF4_HYAAZ|nr:valine--tRNA ligase [Hyalella azteca]
MSDLEVKNNALNEDGTPKTAKQLEKEAKKAAKLAKFNEKQAKVAATADSKQPEKSKENQKKPPKKEEKPVVTYDLATPAGEKKDVSVELPGQYSPQYVEAAWYPWWKKQGFFKPEYGRDLSKPNPAGQFVMVIPPPNVTGSLHLGHALTNSVEDAITRWHRMKGRTTLWVPGCDHAGIATQVVVEKKLKREENKSRHDLGREEFVKRVWQWKEDFIVPLVEKRELTGRTELSVPGHPDKVVFGVLVQFAYPVKDSAERLVVATTRIETMLGDTAVAVHPDDKRYQHLLGSSVVHPITGAVLPIIADAFVDMEFGTGAVKITPAHDPNDYDVGKRHDLPFVNILTDEGRIVEGFGEFSGQHRFECRVKLTKKLEELGFYVDTKDNPMVVPICSRSKDIIEPLLKPQWYVKCDAMAEDAIAVVASGELEIIPKVHEKTWNHWMSGIRDWCISRQLWWGHRIPAYYVTWPQAEQAGVDEAARWVCGRSEAEARKKAATKFGVAESEISLVQDPDVLDTWYSSALFPFSVMGWPEKTRDMELFYPGTLLETGHDILFFWVARMVFFGRKLLGKLPFKQVYLHAMVRDAHGRKMSKSLGNVIDPMDVIKGITLEELHLQLEENSNLDPKEVEKAKMGQKSDYPKGIPECGTDALRFALCAYTSQGRDINLDVLRVNGYRNFCNKLWNATKFAMMNLATPFTPFSSLKELHAMGSLRIVDRWMLSQLAVAVRDCNAGFQDYNFQAATSALYSLWWYNICDSYLECIKPRLYGQPCADRDAAQQVLWTCLHTGLRLISPFMPFLSEELFQRLPVPPGAVQPESICVAPYPDTEDYLMFIDEEAEEQFKLGQKVINEVRSAKAKYDIPNKSKIELSLMSDNSSTQMVLESLSRDIATLAIASSVTVTTEQPSGSVPTPVGGDCVAWLKLQGLVDLSKCEERLQKKLAECLNKSGALTADMAKDSYAKVPDDVKEKNSDRLKELKAEEEQTRDAIQQLAAMKKE